MPIASMSPPRSKAVCIVDVDVQETKCGDPAKGYRAKPGAMITCVHCLTVTYSGERDKARRERDAWKVVALGGLTTHQQEVMEARFKRQMELNPNTENT